MSFLPSNIRSKKQIDDLYRDQIALLNTEIENNNNFTKAIIGKEFGVVSTPQPKLSAEEKQDDLNYQRSQAFKNLQRIFEDREEIQIVLNNLSNDDLMTLNRNFPFIYRDITSKFGDVDGEFFIDYYKQLKNILNSNKGLLEIQGLKPPSPFVNVIKPGVRKPIPTKKEIDELKEIMNTKENDIPEREIGDYEGGEQSLDQWDLKQLRDYQIPVKLQKLRKNASPETLKKEIDFIENLKYEIMAHTEWLNDVDKDENREEKTLIESLFKRLERFKTQRLQKLDPEGIYESIYEATPMGTIPSSSLSSTEFIDLPQISSSTTSNTPYDEEILNMSNLKEIPEQEEMESFLEDLARSRKREQEEMERMRMTKEDKDILRKLRKIPYKGVQIPSPEELDGQNTKNGFYKMYSYDRDTMPEIRETVNERQGEERETDNFFEKIKQRKAEQELLTKMGFERKAEQDFLTKMGFGLRKNIMKYGNKGVMNVKKVIMGKGISAEEMPKYVNFGKFVIHFPQLVEQNIFNLKYKSLGGIPQLKPFRVSEDMKDFMIDLIENEKVNERLFKRLSNEEKKRFEKIVTFSKLNKKLGIQKVDLDEENKEKMRRFELVRGQFIAGNNADSVKKELLELIYDFTSGGMINAEEGRDILLSLLK
jgi:hypothetical protein